MEVMTDLDEPVFSVLSFLVMLDLQKFDIMSFNMYRFIYIMHIVMLYMHYIIKHNVVYCYRTVFNLLIPDVLLNTYARLYAFITYLSLESPQLHCH